CSKQRLIKQVSCNSKQLNFYKNMLICVGLIYPLITLNFSSFYCVSLFTISYSCYFFVTSPIKMGFALWQTPTYQNFIIYFLDHIMPSELLAVILFCAGLLNDVKLIIMIFY